MDLDQFTTVDAFVIEIALHSITQWL